MQSRQQQRAGKFLHMPALFRMKGIILASRSAEDYFEAEESLLSAIDWAKRQSATLFELKAATDLAELLLKQERMPEAYKHLSAALDRTPAGMVFPDHTARPANPQPTPIWHRGCRRLKRHLRVLSAVSAVGSKSSHSDTSSSPQLGACCGRNGHSSGCMHGRGHHGHSARPWRGRLGNREGDFL